MTSINTGTSMNDTSSLRSRTVNKTENGTTIVSGNDNSDKDLFLKLLVAQMKNQDPFNSQDPTQYITQLAQFNMLEQSMALNENIEYLIGMTNGILANSAVGSATNLIGKEVEAYQTIITGDDGMTYQGYLTERLNPGTRVEFTIKDNKLKNVNVLANQNTRQPIKRYN